MRALAPFFAVLASIFTIFATIVRLWWSKPRLKPGAKIYDDGVNPTREGVQVLEPKAPSWLQTTAKWWLRIVVFGVTIGAIVILVVIVVRIIELSS